MTAHESLTRADGAGQAAAASEPSPEALRRTIGRSLGLWTSPVLALVIAVNTLARDTSWTREWLWAAYQYHFTVVVLGPVVAALATVEGARWARRSPVGDRRSLAAAWAALMLWVGLVYVGGLAAVLGWADASGMPGAPRWGELLSLGPPLALLAAESAAGFAAGVRTRRYVWAPAVGVACLAVVLWSYRVFGPANPLVVGGATASLVGLRLRPDLQAAQTLCFAGVAAATLLGLRVDTGDAGRPPSARAARLRTPLTVAVLGSAVVVVALVRSDQFEPVAPDLRCDGGPPAFCAAPGYSDRLPAVRRAAEPRLAALRRTGVVTPPRFEQAAVWRSPSRAVDISGSLLAARPGPVLSDELVTWYVPAGCGWERDPALIAAYGGAYDWLEHAGSPGVVTADPAGEERFRRSVATLRACRDGRR